MAGKIAISSFIAIFYSRLSRVLIDLLLIVNDGRDHQIRVCFKF